MAKPENSSRRHSSRNQHCFPDFQCAPIHDSTATDDACALFRPIYQNDATSTGFTVSAGDASGGKDASDEGVDSALDQCYREGFEAGQKEAHQLVQEGLVPHLHSFCDAYRGLHRSLDRLLSTSGITIPTLARAIAEKILHHPVQHPLPWMDALQGQLSDVLSRAYRLRVVMNPKDHRLLNFLTKDSQAFEDAEPLHFITTQPDIPCGRVQLERGNHTITDADIPALIDSENDPQSSDRVAVPPSTSAAIGPES